MLLTTIFLPTLASCFSGSSVNRSVDEQSISSFSKSADWCFSHDGGLRCISSCHAFGNLSDANLRMNADVAMGLAESRIAIAVVVLLYFIDGEMRR